MSDNENVTYKRVIGGMGAFIALLLTALAVILWTDRNAAWAQIIKNNDDIKNTLAAITQLRLDSTATLASKSDIKEVSDKVERVMENQRQVELALHDSQRGLNIKPSKSIE
jgi:hypothetical protein